VAEPNAAQREQWNGEGGFRWIADADRRDLVLAPVLRVLLDSAALQPSEDVLDIGCGCGISTTAAHELTKPGTALGIDISEPMLRIARERTTGTTGIAFAQADAQTHRFDPAFDVVIGRFGTMFFDDPIAAHANIRTALRPGGRLCLATWQPLDANDWLLIPGAALLRHGTMPETESGPGMFAQSDPAQIATVLEAAGWDAVHVEPVQVTLNLGADPDEATDYLTGMGIARRVLDTIDEADRPRAIAEVTELLAGSLADDGVELGAGINIITARAA
jgi:SAM-dependent methyltransferase